MQLNQIKIKTFVGKAAVAVFRWIFILAFCYVLLYPIFFMISGMIKSPLNYTDPTVIWVPKKFSLDSIGWAIDAMSFWDSFKNTVLLQLISAAIEVVSCAFAAYGIARFEFRYKKLLLFFMILTILLPVQLTIIPIVLNYKNLDFLGLLGLINNIFGVDLRVNILDTAFAFYLPSVFAVGLRGSLIIFIYMQFFKGLPKELEEAAWIDGSGPAKTFLKIIVPSSGVVIVTVCLFSFIWHWNDYFLSLMYTSTNRTLAVMLSNIFMGLQAQGFYPQTPQAVSAALAGCLLFILIPLVVYIILQRQFIQSIDRVGIVG